MDGSNRSNEVDIGSKNAIVSVRILIRRVLVKPANA